MVKKVIVLGGGVGGAVAARRLSSKLSQPHQIELIDISTKHYFQPAFLGVVTDRINPGKVSNELKNIERSNLKYINEEVTEIDADNQQIKTQTASHNFDYLVVALGAKLALEKIPGLREAGFTPYQLESAIQLRDQIKNFNGNKIAILICSMPYKCPAAPYETAFLLDAIFRKNGKRKNISISIYTPEGQPMPTAGPEAGAAIKGLLEGKDIGFHPGLKISSVDSTQRRLVFDDDKEEQYDLLVYVPPHTVPEVVAESPLAGETGWVPVDMRTLETKHANIYAIGDVSAIKLPGAYKPEMPLLLPKAGVFAHEQAKIVADNIASKIAGKSPVKTFGGEGACFLEAGDKKAGFAKGDFFAQPKPMINMQHPKTIHYFNKLLFEKYWLFTKP